MTDGGGTSWVMDGRTGCGLVLLTTCAFQLLHETLSFVPLPKKVAKTADAFKIFRWRNLVISWTHAVITGIWTYLCFAIYGIEMYEDMLSFINWPTYAVCCFATGYFLYDTLDIVWARRIREKWEILIHHGAIILCASYNIVNATGIGYHVLSMSIEFQTAFLHSRKMFQLSGLSDRYPRVSAVLCVLNLFTFIPCRFVPVFIMLHAGFTQGHRVPRWYLCVYTVCATALTIVNCILYYRLLKTDVFASDKRRQRPTMAANCHENGVEKQQNGNCLLFKANGDAKKEE